MSSVSHAEAYLEGSENQPKGNENQPTRFEEGKEGAHDLLDKTDERSIANKLAAAAQKDKEEKEAEANKPLPTEIAKSHGNEPSRGAKIDEQIMLEEQAELQRFVLWLFLL
ncbi:BQ2448_1743 [Microbotryum intermedium]|uniref:BQ2448_1743 protein n=1 Tax=Microbotryum intermedium TaxID=269621 RepID=A0A238FC33_9BASI|nr:BQ2448_1743 [Microbotryum intermedium]